MLIAGEPGVGKTRLAHRFARELLDAGARVLAGRCSEEPLAAFEPFAEALRPAGLADVLQPGEDAGPGARHRLFGAVDAALGDLAGERGLLLVIDDLHWADRGTLLLIGFLLRSERTAPLLVLGTYRDTELGRHSPLTGALAELQRDGVLQRIGLRGLSEEDVAALARALLGDDTAAARVHARTDGNAFFVEEVLRGLAERHELPESVRHAVGVRLAGLGEDANALLAAAAVLGTELDPRALEEMAELDDAESALDEVLRARLLRPAPTGGRVEFAHALVREAVYDELNALRRARLHRRAAEALHGLGGHLEEIAHHLFEAGEARAGRRAVAAGRPARGRGARLRGRRRALRARAGGVRAGRRRGRGRPGAARTRRRAAARRGAGERARAVQRGGAAGAPERRSRRCWPRRRSATRASGSRSSTSTPRRSPASRRRSRRWRLTGRRCARACWRGWRSSSTTRPDATARRRSAPTP